MSIRTSFSLVAAAAALSMGCQKKESVDSRDVTTHGMSIELDITNDGNRSKVEAKLHVGSYKTLVYARLTEGEQLILNDPNGGRRALSVLRSGDESAYGAEVEPFAGTYTIDFIRVKGSASALANVVDVPQPFAVSAPTVVSRKEPLTFTWNAGTDASAKMSYALSGDCLSSHAPKEIIGDPGTFTLNAGELKAFTGKETESCQVKLTLVRTRTNEACCSAEFGHPSIARGRQVRTLMFQSAP